MGVRVAEGNRIRPKGLSRFWPILLLIVAGAVVMTSGVGEYLRYEALTTHFAELRQYVRLHPAAALAVLVVVYALGTAVSIPAMSVVSVASGALYGVWLGTLGVTVGATLGATAVFHATHTSFGTALRARAGPWLRRFQKGFRRNEFFYLLALRLIPIIPFWVLNVVPGFLGMRLRNYILATVLGILPGTLVYVAIGAGAAKAIANGDILEPGRVLMQPHILLPLFGLALLAVLPVFLQQWAPFRALLGENGDADRGSGRGDGSEP